MEKYNVEWRGKSYPARVVQLPEVLGGYEVSVTTTDIYDAYEAELNNGNKEAVALDNTLYFFFGNGFIESDPTDEEIVQKILIEEFGY